MFNYDSPLLIDEALHIEVASDGSYGRFWYRDPKESGSIQVSVFQRDQYGNWTTPIDEPRDELRELCSNFESFVQQLVRATFSIGQVSVHYADGTDKSFNI